MPTRHPLAREWLIEGSPQRLRKPSILSLLSGASQQQQHRPPAPIRYGLWRLNQCAQAGHPTLTQARWAVNKTTYLETLANAKSVNEKPKENPDHARAG
jgi:hypothetical protein